MFFAPAIQNIFRPLAYATPSNKNTSHTIFRCTSAPHAALSVSLRSPGLVDLLLHLL